MLLILQIVLTLGLAIYGVLTAIKWKKVPLSKKIVSIISIILAIVIAINGLQKIQEEILISNINSKIGNIDDVEGATFPRFQVDESGTYMQFPNNVPAFVSGNKPILAVYVKNEKLHVFCVVRDKNGEVIAAIDENEWTRFSDDYEYNNDKTAFEIVTKGERDVYFRVELKNGVANLTGYFLDEEGDGLCLAKARNKKGAGLVKIRKGMDKSLYPSFFTEKLFKYPRDTHLGERVNVQ